MKYIKMLGLAAMAAVALMAFAGSASATTLTDGSGVHPTSISLTATHGITKNALITITCTHSALSANVSTGGEGLTVSGSITAWSFSSCANNWHKTVTKPGSLEIHSIGGNSGLLTDSGTEITAENTSNKLHCVFTTNGTTIGTIKGGSPAVLTVNAAIPRTGGRSGAFCGGTHHATGTYTVTSPSTLNID